MPKCCGLRERFYFFQEEKAQVMRLHYLQHVPFEDLANIEVWARNKGHRISKTAFFDGTAKLPQTDDFDWLVVMGGPMNIYEEDLYPWLAGEKRFIARAIEQQKTVLGVCLGAQLIADILGGKVFKNAYKEIGWFPVTLTAEGIESNLTGNLPKRFAAFHWHGDTFHLPPGCKKLAESEGCANQAFEYEGRVVGLQFHLESSEQSVNRLIANCGNELVEGTYIQKPDDMLSKKERFRDVNAALAALLDNMEKKLG